MAQVTVTGAAEPSPSVAGSFTWHLDTLPGAIGSAEPDIRFLTLADLVPEPATMAGPPAKRRRRGAMRQAFAEAYAASICHRLALALGHAEALRLALKGDRR